MATVAMNEPSLADLTARARQALGHWHLAEQVPELLKYRENAVFRVHLADGRPAALRLHRPGYHGAGALTSELQWMAALGAAGIAVPAPVATPDGRQIVCLEEQSGFTRQYADIVSWMSGAPLGQSNVPFTQGREQLGRIFHALGEAMARMHAASDGWTPPADFSRHAWNADGFLGDRPLWGRFWDCPGLSEDEGKRLSNLRQFLLEQLGRLSVIDLDYGLIHADLVRENVLVTADGRMELIDFDDGGYGWRLFDIATALFKNRSEPDYPTIEGALIAGYRNVRPLTDTALAQLPLFTLLRSVTYIGWIGERPGLADAPERLKRYVADTLALAVDLPNAT